MGGGASLFVNISIITAMNSRQRIQLHLHCMWLKPNHLGFHARGIGRELPILIGAAIIAAAAQWMAWHIK